MAQFKILLLNIHSDTNTNGGLKVLSNVMSEYYSKEEKVQSNDAYTFSNQQNNFCYTYNEKFKIGQNSQKTLSFTMDSKIIREDCIEDNPFVRNVYNGSQILLIDKDDNHHLFTVNNISYSFKQSNLIYNYECQDSFTYQLSRQNNGYTIENNIDSADFLGAHNVDWWVKKMIMPDCHISYNYIGLEENFYLNGNDLPFQEPNNVKKVLKKGLSSTSEYLKSITFSGNGTANSILISLGEQRELNLRSYERLVDNNLYRYFWFEPKKKDTITGLSYSPYSDIQSFSLKHNGTSLSSILNVTGGEFGDETITLLPELPSFFRNYFNSAEWDTSVYTTGMFSSLCQNKTYVNTDETKPLTAGTYILSNIPNNYRNGRFFKYDGALYIPIYDLINEDFFRIPQWYDFLSFSREKDFSYIEAMDNTLHLQTFKSCDSNWSLVVYSAIDLLNPIEITANKTTLPEAIKSQSTTLYPFLKINIGSLTIGSIIHRNIYTTFYREASDNELEFAMIADQCPWLENKLVDFNYYYTHKILNYSEYSNLMNIFTNELRIINGHLMVYAQQYYAALHHQTKIMADLTAKIDALGATFNAEMLYYYTHNKSIPDVPKDFQTAYDLLFNVPNTYTKEKLLLNYNELLADYVNKYIDAEQRFLKNCYNFRKFFNERIGFANEDATLHNITISFNTMPKTADGKNFYGFSQQQWILISNSFDLYDKDEDSPTYGRIYTDVFQKDAETGYYTKLEDKYIIDKEKWSLGWNNSIGQNNIYYIPIYNIGDFKAITTAQPYNKDIQYYEPAYVVRDDIKYEKIKYATNINTVTGTCDFTVKELENSYQYEYTITASVILSSSGNNLFTQSNQHLYGYTSSNEWEEIIKPNDFIYQEVSWSKLLKSYWCHWKTKDSYEDDNYYFRKTDCFYPVMTSDNNHEPLLYLHTWPEDAEVYAQNNWWDIYTMGNNWDLNSILSRYALTQVKNNALDINSNVKLAYWSNFPITNVYFKDYETYFDSNSQKTYIVSDKQYQKVPLLGATNFNNYYRRITTNSTKEKWKIALTCLVMPLTGAVWSLAQMIRSKGNNCLGNEGTTYISAENKNIGNNFDATWAVNDFTEFTNNIMNTNNDNRSFYYWFVLSQDALSNMEELGNTVLYYDYDTEATYEVGALVKNPVNNKIYRCIKKANKQRIDNVEYWIEDTNAPSPLSQYTGYWNYYKWYVPHYRRFFSTRENDTMIEKIDDFTYKSTGFIKPLDLDNLVNANDSYLIVFQDNYTDDSHWEPFNEQEVFLGGFSIGSESINITNEIDIARYNMVHYYPLNGYFVSLDTHNAACIQGKKSVSLRTLLAEVMGTSELRFSQTNSHYAIHYAADDSENDKYFYVFHEENYCPVYLKYWNYDGRGSQDENNDNEYTNFVNAIMKVGNVYYVNSDARVDFKKDIDDFIVPGLYYKVIKDENLIPSTEFSLNNNYYRNIGINRYEKVYTKTELTGNNYFYQQNLSYSVENFSTKKEDKYSISTNMYKFTIDFDDNNHSYCGQQSYNAVIPGVEFSWDSDADSGTGEVEIEGQTYSFNWEDKKILVGHLTNGEYWAEFNNKLDNTTLLQYAGLIETTLTEYWTAAYNASFYCKWFLPQYWQQYVDNEENALFDKIIQYKQKNISYANAFSNDPSDISSGQLVSNGWIKNQTSPQGYKKSDRYLSNEDYIYDAELLEGNALNVVTLTPFVSQTTSADSVTYTTPHAGVPATQECERNFIDDVLNNSSLKIAKVESVTTQDGYEEDLTITYSLFEFNSTSIMRALKKNNNFISSAERLRPSQFFTRGLQNKLDKLQSNCYYFLESNEGSSDTDSWLYKLPIDSVDLSSIRGVVIDDNAVSYTLALTNYFLPEVEIYSSDTKYRYYNYTSINDYYNFITDNSIHKTLDQSYYSLDTVLNQSALLPIKESLTDLNIANDGRTGYWAAVKMYDNCTYYRYTNGGKTWASLVGEITNNNIAAEYFSGWYNMMVSVLTNGSFMNQAVHDYEYYQYLHNNVWDNIYKLYPNVILEESYNNTDATTSTELYDTARLTFKDYTQPEAQYNITTIDINNLQGYKGQELNIGDVIDLTSDELYNNYDDLKTSLQQHLFITDLNYTLRSDKDIAIGVNVIKYGDKVIKELIKLIR